MNLQQLIDWHEAEKSSCYAQYAAAMACKCVAEARQIDFKANWHIEAIQCLKQQQKPAKTKETTKKGHPDWVDACAEAIWGDCDLGSGPSEIANTIRKHAPKPAVGTTQMRCHCCKSVNTVADQPFPTDLSIQWIADAVYRDYVGHEPGLNEESVDEIARAIKKEIKRQNQEFHEST